MSRKLALPLGFPLCKMTVTVEVPGKVVFVSIITEDVVGLLLLIPLVAIALVDNAKLGTTRSSLTDIVFPDECVRSCSDSGTSDKLLTWFSVKAGTLVGVSREYSGLREELFIVRHGKALVGVSTPGLDDKLPSVTCVVDTDCPDISDDKSSLFCCSSGLSTFEEEPSVWRILDITEIVCGICADLLLFPTEASEDEDVISGLFTGKLEETGLCIPSSFCDANDFSSVTRGVSMRVFELNMIDEGKALMTKGLAAI